MGCSWSLSIVYPRLFCKVALQVCVVYILHSGCRSWGTLLKFLPNKRIQEQICFWKKKKQNWGTAGMITIFWQAQRTKKKLAIWSCILLCVKLDWEKCVNSEITSYKQLWRSILLEPNMFGASRSSILYSSSQKWWLKKDSLT